MARLSLFSSWTVVPLTKGFSGTPFFFSHCVIYCLHAVVFVLVYDMTIARPLLLLVMVVFFGGKVYSIAIEAGATTINVPDTVGYTTPKEFLGLMHHLRRTVRCGWLYTFSLSIPSVRKHPVLVTAARRFIRKSIQYYCFVFGQLTPNGLDIAPRRQHVRGKDHTRQAQAHEDSDIHHVSMMAHIASDVQNM